MGKRQLNKVGKVVKYLVFYASLAVIRPCHSQDPVNPKEYTITWQSPTILTVGSGEIRPILDFENAVHIPEYSYLPVVSIELGPDDPNGVSIEITRDEELTEFELDMIDYQGFTDSPKTVFRFLRSKGSGTYRMWLLPFFRDLQSGRVRKVLAFRLNVEDANGPEEERLLSSAESIFRKGDSFESVLSSGDWFTIGVTEDGIYRIDYDFLIDLGIDPGALDPKTIRLFGNGAYILPQKNDEPVPEDLLENSIIIEGEDDNRFDPEDYILFYGRSPHKLQLINGTQGVEIDYQNNFYSDTAYYFLNISDNPGLRIGESENLGNSFPTINSFDYLAKYEDDMLNILNSGRDWYGDKFDLKTTYDYDFEVEGLSSNEVLKIVSRVMASSYTSSYFEIDVNGFILGQQQMETIPDTRYGIRGTSKTDTFTINTIVLPENTDNLKVRLKYVKAGSTVLSAGYLDFLNIWCVRDLATYNSQTIFQSAKSTGNAFSTFTIRETGQETTIWDVTDPFAPQIQIYTRQNGQLLFGAETALLRKFIMFNEDNILVPVPGDKIDNQDLHGSTPKAFIIITHPDFIAAADRLKTHREQRGISTEVVTTQQVYNEFSSGAQDISAIRNFIKYRYDQSPGSEALKYVLLLGRGSYDYKERIPNNTNFVPIYESRNSLHPIYSYSSDDYYTFLDDGEGEWEENFLGDYGMDISVGRIPVVSSFEALDVINKIIMYESDTRSYGPWRNDICFVADDGDGVDGIRHSSDAEKLSVMVDTSYSNFNIGKIYVDAFPQIILPDKQESPEARQAVNDAIKRGVLIMNFTGHGNELQWTSEKILDNTMVTKWENLYKLPFFVTATCEYGRHENPILRSGAEYAMINKRGGVIGLVTTSRPVFASTNFILNRAFYSEVFKKVQGRYQTVGEIFRNTKNESLNGVVNRNFSLLGDPSMKLAYPEQNVVIEAINEKPIDTEIDTLKALKKVTVQGKIMNSDQEHMAGYHGVLTAAVYDKSEKAETLGTQDPVMQYDIRKNLIFNGDVTILQGDFQFEFIVPKNISYAIGDGKISLYAINEEQDLDASGSNIEIPVGGSQNGVEADNIPPDIMMFLEDTTFVNGDLTSDHPRLIAYLFDENGISITENGVNRGIVATLDEKNNFVLNNFYKANIDDFQSGVLSYQFSELQEGLHYLTLRVWDTHNNMAEAYLEFIVGESHELVIKNLLNYPNPFRDNTTFSFEHNRSGEDLEITVQIYSSKGNLVKVLEGLAVNSDFRINDIHWDGRGGSGKKLESGLYVYRVYVRSLVDGAKNEDFKKLVIIN